MIYTFIFICAVHEHTLERFPFLYPFLLYLNGILAGLVTSALYVYFSR